MRILFPETTTAPSILASRRCYSSGGSGAYGLEFARFRGHLTFGDDAPRKEPMCQGHISRTRMSSERRPSNSSVPRASPSRKSRANSESRTRRSRNGLPNPTSTGDREGLTTEEQEELRRLQREVKRLRMERDILKKRRPSSPTRARDGSDIPLHRGGEGQLPRELHEPATACN